MEHRLPLFTAFCVCALTLAILLTACTTTPPASSGTPTDPTDDAATDNVTNNATETPTETPTVSSDNNNALTVIYTDLETLCSHNPASNVVSATYLGVAGVINDELTLSFRTEKNHMGLAMAEEFQAVYFPDEDPYAVDPSLVPFEEGKTYLILLTRYRSVYQEQDEFVVIGSSLLIPTEDFQNARMYDKPLASMVTGMEITEQTTPEEFTEYLVGLFKDVKDFMGTDYIDSDDLTEILTKSPNVYAITVESVTSDLSVRTVTLRCRVDKVYKGEEPKDGYADVMFPLEADIKLGDSLIVTLSEAPGGTMNWYKFSAKNAMYPLAQADEVQSIIDGATE